MSLRTWLTEQRDEVRAARDQDDAAEARAAELHQRHAAAAVALHPDLSVVDIATGAGGADHLSVIAGAWAEVDRDDRAELRRRAVVLAERRALAPVPAGRTHAEVVADFARWSDWVDAAAGRDTAGP